MKTSDQNVKLPTKKFRAINKEHLRKLVIAGFTDEQVSDFFDITRDTLLRWKRWYPEFKQEMLEWKIKADGEIEKSLYRSGKGYEFIEKTRELVDGKMKVVKEVTKHIPAVSTAQIFWLTNRKHGDWKRTREEVGADPLSVKVLSIVRNMKDKEKPKGGNGKASKSDNDLSNITVDTAVQIERGGLTIVD